MARHGIGGGSRDQIDMQMPGVAGEHRRVHKHVLLRTGGQGRQQHKAEANRVPRVEE